MLKISPSLLAADFAALGDEVARVPNADMLHVDVMDGHFVPNISIGPAVAAAVRKRTPLFFDVHLMLEHPLAYVPAFREAGADSICFHVECADDPWEVLKAIRKAGARPAMAISPDTPPQALEPYAEELWMVTVMTVYPGFGGQKLIPACLEKASWLKKRFPRLQIEVDGGVNFATAGACAAAGVDILVAGTAVFGDPDPQAAIERLRSFS